ncbi:hypothetical protein DRP05_09555 [Archaeoglobales archaeon]|nr:MAG: hypothetical protein DRP05_09555 [Archaeoglobales archaeon]
MALKVCQRGDVEEKAVATASFLIYFNNVWYRYSDEGQKAFNDLERHISDIYELLKGTNSVIEELKETSITTVDLSDSFIENSIKTLYRKFSEVFGATGASKALHLLLPNLFVMWDDSIRKNYQVVVPNENEYLNFLKTVKDELVDFIKDCSTKNGLDFEGAEKFIKEKTGVELTKLIDELNYLKFTRKEFAKTEVDKSDKINRILEIINEIVEGAYEASQIEWVVKTKQSGMVVASASKLKKIVEEYAKKGDTENILRYLQNVQGDATGIKVYKILKACGKKPSRMFMMRLSKLQEGKIPISNILKTYKDGINNRWVAKL